MQIPLTDMGVQKLRPGTYFDTKTPSFGIRVGKHRRTWIIMKGQHPRRSVMLGQWAECMILPASQPAKAPMMIASIQPSPTISSLRLRCLYNV